MRVRAEWQVGQRFQPDLNARLAALSDSFIWSRPSESNRRPFDYESNALPTELGRLVLIPEKAELQNIRFGDGDVKQLPRRAALRL